MSQPESGSDASAADYQMAVAAIHEPFARQGAGGYDQCWYPVAIADDLKPGKIVGMPFLSGRVIVYRGQNGKAQVMSAYCAHLGADLSAGTVIGDDVQCPFHHWQYGASGRCLRIPAGDAIPRGARLYAYPTEEALGLIWAFNGDAPLYPVPSLNVDPAEWIWYQQRVRDQGVEPPVAMCNTFDFQHFRVVHHFHFDEDPKPEWEPFRVSYKFRGSREGVIPFEQRFGIIGSNVFFQDGYTMGRPIRAVAALTPLPNGQSMLFNVTCTRRPTEGDETALQEAHDFLMKIVKLRLDVLDEDWPIIRLLGHPRRSLLVKSDTLLGRFIGHLRRLPRAHPGGPFID
jgi:nitrite reductase/ring-hydroxylating ferredoxin subunit